MGPEAVDNEGFLGGSGMSRKVLILSSVWVMTGISVILACQSVRYVVRGVDDKN